MAARAANSLVITQQPVSVFYKDEGGRSNFLCAHIALPASYQGPPVRLATSLYFECGRRVEEQDQDILSLLDFKYAPAVVAPGKPCVLRYRLEKVSRRKDNQKFKVKVEVDKSAAGAGTPAAVLGHVFTNPVSVLSKRKTGERFVVRRNPSPQQRMKEFTATLRNIVGTLVEKVDSLQASIDANTAAVAQQGERLERLEAMMCAPQQVRFLARGAGATIAGGDDLDDDMATADVDRDVAALEDDGNMKFLSSLWDASTGDAQSTAAQRAVFGLVPPVTRSLSKELIDGAAAASFAMGGGAADDAWATMSASSLKRSRATTGPMTSPAGGSGEDSPRSDGAPKSPPVEARPPLPRLKLITGRPNAVPKMRRWRSMEITFSRRAADAGADVRRPFKRRATADLVLA